MLARFQFVLKSEVILNWHLFPHHKLMTDCLQRTRYSFCSSKYNELNQTVSKNLIIFKKNNKLLVKSFAWLIFYGGGGHVYRGRT